jgi:hypothetical protein
MKIPPPPLCADDNRVQGVDFVGVANPGTKKWQFTPLPASSASNCCSQCYKAFPDGCQAWAYIPINDTKVPCNLIWGFPGQDVDKDCPQGHAFIVIGRSDEDDYKDSFGGAGPCGTTTSASRHAEVLGRRYQVTESSHWG